MKQLLVVLVLLGSSQVAIAAPTWSELKGGTWSRVSVKEHATGTIEVLTRDVGGLPCFQGLTTTDLKPAELLPVVQDIVGPIKWSTAGITEGKVLGRQGSSLDYYQYLDVPGWTMASDRYWFLRGTVLTEGSATVFTWQRLVDGGPYAEFYASVKAAHPTAIEPPVNVGGWMFTDLGGQTRIQYFVCSDVGGTLPTAVQSVATKGTLPDTVGDVIAEARRRRAP